MNNSFKSFAIYKILTAMLVLACTMSAVSLKAQTNDTQDTLKFYWGPYAGYNINFHFANFKELLVECPTCTPVDYGFNTGGGFAFGGLFEYLIYSDGKRTPMRIGARLGYSDASATFVTEEFIGNVLPPNGGAPVRGISEHILEASLPQITIAPYFAYSFTEGLIGNIGLNVGYLMKNTFNQREEFADPDWALFEVEQTRVRNEFNNVGIPEPNPLQLGIMLGIGYELPIGKYSRLTPELQYNLNFNKVSSKLNWKTSSLRLGIAAKFPWVTPAFVVPEIFYQRDTIMEQKIGITTPEIVLLDSKKTLQGNDTLITERYMMYMPKEAALSADLQYYVVENGQRKYVSNITIEEFETTEYFPFLPIVYFPDGSSDLNATRMNSINTSQAADFKEVALSQTDAVLLHKEMLNILGERMKTMPRTTITIRGFSSGVGLDAQNRNIWSERANTVRDYLVNVWNIESRRIKVEHGTFTLTHKPEDKSYNDIVEENQKVQIYSNDLDLLTPIVISRIEKIANPPEIHFELKGNAELGIKKYDFTISQSNQELRKTVNNNTISSLNTTETWNIMTAPVPALETPIQAVLNVSDANSTATSKKDITISQITIRSKYAVDSLNARIERYSLCLFDFDMATLTNLHNKILTNIKSSIDPQAEVFISGYADRTGDSTHNVELAGRRCQSVKNYITPDNKIKTELEAVGSNKLLYDNNTPEGRAFSRTVRIEIYKQD